MTYENEKKYLNKSAIDALKNVDGMSLTLTENNKIKLKYYGEEIDTDVIGIELHGRKTVEVFTCSDAYPNGQTSDLFTDFSNDEMKRILDLFNIKY